MSSKKLRKVLATVAAVAMLAGSVATPMMSVSAGQVLGETSFEYKALPWHTCESSPAKQEFSLDGEAFHAKIIKAKGADGEKWDLQVRYRNLNFKANHKYTVSFKAKAKRAGMELCSKIGNIKGDEEYFVINETKMQMGPHMGGQWGKAAKLTTEYQEFTGTFTPTKDLKAAEWAMHYAKGTKYEGNAQDGDEIWFDDMSIICETCDECDADPKESYGAVSRDWGALAVDEDTYKPGGKLNNYISVNQIGYYSNLSKVAVLGDNKGDITHGASSIDLTKDTYDFDVCDAKSGSVVYSGTSGKKIKDADSADTVCKLDFTEFNKPGRYYIKAGDWRSFEFNIGDNIYSDDSHNMLTNSLNYFYQNRSGIDIEEDYITSGDKSTLAHKGGHKTDTASVQKIWKNEYLSKDEATATYASSKITANGGWYDAGDHGKYVVNGGIAVWTLQNMYERAIQTEEGKEKFADGSGTMAIPEEGNKIPDVLDEAAYELDWMAQMVVKSDEPTWGKYAGLVYHKLHDHKWTGLATKPWEYEEDWGTVRIVKPPTFAATLNLAACAAQAARLWEPYDSTKAAEYLDIAKKAYEAYEKYWYEAAEDEEYNENSLYAPMYQAKGGGPYGDNEVRDDAYWAACEIFVSAKKMGDSAADDYYNKLSEYKNAFEVTTRITGGENKDGSLTTFNWGNTASAGSLSLALHKDILSESEAKTVEDSILAASDEYIKTEDKQGYGIPYLYDGDGYNDPNNLPEDIIIKGYEWGSNSMVINNAIVMSYAYDLTKDVKYMNGVITGMDYLLGTNPLSFSYITGYGTYHEQNPHHRYWSYELDDTLPKAPDGVLSGGPNAGLQDPYVRALGFVSGDEDNPSQRCFVDSIEAWSTNEVTINWNAPLAWIASFLQDEAADAGGDGPIVIPPVGDFMYGDLDENKKVEITDLTYLSMYFLGDYKLSGDTLKAADVNGDGSVDLADLAHLKQYVSKDPVVLGPKK